MIESRVKKDFYIWEGVYKTFEDALKDTTGSGFSGNTYQERSLAAANECLVALDSNEPIPNFHKQRSNFLPVVVAMAMGNKIDSDSTLTILDFGGGLGIGYMVLKESMSNNIKSVDYAIIEVPEVCSVGKTLFKKNEIKYQDSILPFQEFDIIYASSVIQYIEDWQALLIKFSDLKPQFILLSDVFAGTIESFVSLQNYYGSRIPHWFLNLDDLVNCFSDVGYQLIMKSYATSRRLDHEDIIPMSNFPKRNQLKMTLHLLFKRDT
jgi:putative methyltransferase (TIGR04325 family)